MGTSMIPEGFVPLDNFFGGIEQQYSLPSGMLAAVMQTESGGNARAVSPKGAQGAFQFMPATARRFGIDPRNTAQAAQAAAKYLALNYQQFGSWDKAIAAYNAGEGAVAKYGGIPPYKETQGYVQKIMNLLVPAAEASEEVIPELPSGFIPNGVPELPPGFIPMPAPGSERGEDYQGQASQAKTTYDPTEGMSGTEQFFAGLGKTIYDLVRGGGQLTRQAIEAIAPPEKSLSDLVTGGRGTSFADTLGLPTQEDIDEAKRLDAPLMNTGAGVAGNITGSALAFLPAAAIPGANTLVGATAIGAGMGASQPVASDESRLANTALGAAGGFGGQAVGKAVGRLMRPVQRELDPATQALANKARAAGIELNAAQQTASKPLKVIDSVLDNLPFTADKQATAKGTQRAAWQRAVLKEAGEDADVATPDVMGTIKDRVGSEFRRLTATYDLPVDNRLLTELANIEAKYGRRLNVNQRQIVQSYIDDLTSAPSMSGTVYQDARSMLDRQVRGLKNTDPFTSQILKEIRNSLDNAMERTIIAGGNPADAAAWQQARKQWMVMRTTERAADATKGDISPAKFFNELRRKDPNAVVYGQGPQDVADLARIGQTFIREQIPDSGTAQRTFYQNLLTGTGGGLGLGAVSGMIPPGALMGAALTATTPLAMQRALWSKAGQRYLSSGVLSNSARLELLARLLSQMSTGAGATGALNVEP